MQHATRCRIKAPTQIEIVEVSERRTELLSTSYVPQDEAEQLENENLNFDHNSQFKLFIVKTGLESQRTK